MFLFWAFNVFELCCGIYFPLIGTLRSKIVPEQTRASVMNIFRIPLNLMVVLILVEVCYRFLRQFARQLTAIG